MATKLTHVFNSFLIIKKTQDGAVLPVIETTIQSPGRRASDSDEGADIPVPGAPRNNHLPLPGERMDVTEMVIHCFWLT